MSYYKNTKKTLYYHTNILTYNAGHIFEYETAVGPMKRIILYTIQKCNFDTASQEYTYRYTKGIIIDKE